MNETIMQFNYPESLIHEYNSWVVLLRPQQLTLGSLILASKGDYTKLSDIPTEAFTELASITKQIEGTLSQLFQFDKINYLLLMMRDKYVHFHIIPRYSNSRQALGKSFADRSWPLPPDITQPMDLSKEDWAALKELIKENWITY